MVVHWFAICVIGSNLTTPKGPATRRTARILLYTSAFSTHSWWNSRFLSEIHTRRYEEPSYWNSKTISYAGGKHSINFFVSLAFCSFLKLISGIIGQMEMSSVMSSILENQAELMKEVKSLRKENQQLRQLL